MAWTRCDGGVRAQQVGLAGAGRGAADVGARDGAPGGRQHHRRAGQPALDLGMADPQAGDVGQRVVRSVAHAAIIAARTTERGVPNERLAVSRNDDSPWGGAHPGGGCRTGGRTACPGRAHRSPCRRAGRADSRTGRRSARRSSHRSWSSTPGRVGRPGWRSDTRGGPYPMTPRSHPSAAGRAPVRANPGGGRTGLAGAWPGCDGPNPGCGDPYSGCDGPNPGGGKPAPGAAGARGTACNTPPDRPSTRHGTPTPHTRRGTGRNAPPRPPTPRGAACRWCCRGCCCGPTARAARPPAPAPRSPHPGSRHRARPSVRRSR